MTDIVTVQATPSGFLVNGSLHVPNDAGNRHRQMIVDWVAEGGVIAPYVPHPPPTASQRMTSVFPPSDGGQVLLQALFSLANEVKALKGEPTYANINQYLAVLQAHLPARP